MNSPRNARNSRSILEAAGKFILREARKIAAKGTKKKGWRFEIFMPGSVQERAGEGGSAGTSAAQAPLPGGKRFRRLSQSLTPVQIEALAIIAEGKSIPEVATKIGVNRATVYRWMKTDKYFRAGYNAWQLELRESCRLQLYKSAQKAAAKIAVNVEYDKELAWKLIKELGIFGKPQSLSSDPDQIEREIEIEQLEEQARLEERGQHALVLKARESSHPAPSSRDLKPSETPDTTIPCESDAENMLRKVKIGGIIASVVNAKEYDMKHPLGRATECDETSESGACPD
jgi:transposase